MTKNGLWCRGLTLGALLSAALPLSAATDSREQVSYADTDNWLCRPDHLNACDIDLSTTIVHADGRLEREEWAHNPDAPIDCFYVYPTVSQDPTPNSDMNPGAAEMNVVRSQFARMGSQCRLFAPMYRQVTLTALRAGMGDGEGMNPDRELGYNDVRNAWNYYLDNHNEGRGVVLVGHSQGAGVLSRLIASEIEGTEQQQLLVSAMIIGSNVQVPRGQLTGGTFQQLPLCQSGDEIGCVIAYASFREDVPPPSASLFGRNSGDNIAACTNPAQLAKGSNELHAYLSNAAAEGFSATGPAPWTSSGESIDTPFVSVPGLLDAECISNETFSYLQVTVNANPDDERTDDISGDVVGADGEINPVWGLHLVDMNLAMGDLISIIEQQARTHQALQTPDH